MQVTTLAPQVAGLFFFLLWKAKKKKEEQIGHNSQL